MSRAHFILVCVRFDSAADHSALRDPFRALSESIKSSGNTRLREIIRERARGRDEVSPEWSHQFREMQVRYLMQV